MLIITGECQYTLLGLSHLLARLAPQTMSTTQWMANDNVPSGVALLMVTTRYQALADLLPVAEKAHFDGVRLALLGHSGQGVLMNSCGLSPDCVIDSQTPSGELQGRLRDWLRFCGVLRQPRSLRGHLPEVLTMREREVLRYTLDGVPTPVASRLLGITPKTFYALRLNALGRLGLKNTRALLANPVTGVPVPVSRYDRLWCPPTRQVALC